jgi:AcrR family transcriptional regulator
MTRRRASKVDLGARRAPVQERSKERVAKILGAAAALLDEGGLDAVTTNAIAREAGLPVGTLYQFFPNREAILLALAEQSLEALSARFAPQLEQGAGLDPIDRVIDTLRDAYVDIPGLAVLVGTTQGHPALEEVYATNNARIVGWVEALIAAEGASPDARGAAVVAVEASDAVLRRWLRGRARGERGGERLLEHLKAMLRAYFGPMLTAATARARGPAKGRRPKK